MKGLVLTVPCTLGPCSQQMLHGTKRSLRALGQACSSAKWIRSASRSGAGRLGDQLRETHKSAGGAEACWLQVWQYTFINLHGTYTVSVTDNSGSGITYKAGMPMRLLSACR